MVLVQCLPMALRFTELSPWFQENVNWSLYHVNEFREAPTKCFFQIDISSWKHLRTKVTPDFHLTYSKNGGNLGSESK